MTAINDYRGDTAVSSATSRITEEAAVDEIAAFTKLRHG